MEFGRGFLKSNMYNLSTSKAIYAVFGLKILRFQFFFSGLRTQPTNRTLVWDYNPNTPLHDSAPPTPAQDLVVEVDEQLKENDNGVDNSDEHMDGVEVMGDTAPFHSIQTSCITGLFKLSEMSQVSYATLPLSKSIGGRLR